MISAELEGITGLEYLAGSFQVLREIPAGCQLDDHRCSWPGGSTRVITKD